MGSQLLSSITVEAHLDSTVRQCFDHQTNLQCKGIDKSPGKNSITTAQT